MTLCVGGVIKIKTFEEHMNKKLVLNDNFKIFFRLINLFLLNEKKPAPKQPTFLTR